MDEFILSARIYCPSVVPALAQLHGKASRTKRFDDGGVILSFEPRAVPGNDRQEQFEAQWQELIRLFQSFQSLPDVLAYPRSLLELRLSLCPDEGQAGLVLAANQLRAWVELGGDVAVDSL